LTQAYVDQNPGDPAQDRWERTYKRWRASGRMRAFFPQRQDVYIDGGAIDNTPSNSAIDATREWVELTGSSKRDACLDLYIVFLHPEPTITPEEISDPAFHQVISRTLEIQSAAKQSSDAVTVDTINTFGRRAENLGDTLSVVLESYQALLQASSPEQRQAIEDELQQRARDAGLRGYLGSDSEGILDRMQSWAQDLTHNKLPLQINKVVIYPHEMPMSTLQFTERLGYRHENAIRMLTSGCSHTLWTLLHHLGELRPPMDQQDQVSLALVQQWTGIDEVPKDEAGWQAAEEAWSCQRRSCVFHAAECPRGARQP
jgi:hypothetical protein